MDYWNYLMPRRISLSDSRNPSKNLFYATFLTAFCKGYPYFHDWKSNPILQPRKAPKTYEDHLHRP